MEAALALVETSGVDLELRDDQGMTALMWSSMLGFRVIVVALLQVRGYGPLYFCSFFVSPNLFTFSYFFFVISFVLLFTSCYIFLSLNSFTNLVLLFLKYFFRECGKSQFNFSGIYRYFFLFIF